MEENYKVIEKYGIRLERLTEDKIELVRRWRNDPKISQYMEYREEITPEMQAAWFKKIDNNNNFYYLIIINEKEIGLINVRDVDYKQGVGEPGIFIWDDEYLNTPASVRASLAFTDFCFEVLNLKKLIIHVLNDNPRAIRHNKSLGYRLQPNQEDVYNQEYTLDYESYIQKREKYIKYLR